MDQFLGLTVAMALDPLVRFGHVGAMVEGTPNWFENAVARDVFIVDVASGAAGNEVVLYRYEITNTVSPPYDTVSYKLLKTVPLPLIGGATVRCSMAASAGYLYIGTNKSTSAVQVTKQTYAIVDVGGFSNEPTVTAITADDLGICDYFIWRKCYWGVRRIRTNR